MAKKDIFLEDSVLDDLSEGLDIIEQPLPPSIFGLVSWIIGLIIIVVVGRLAYIQIINGKLYQARALANAGQQTVLKAPRGIIYDRYGRILVTNKPSFGLSLNLSELFKDGQSLDSTLGQISSIIPFDVGLAKNEILSVDLEKQAYFQLVPDVTLAQVIELKKLDLKSIVIDNSYSRQYVDGPIFSQILGYTGLVTQKDLNGNSDLSLNDEIGKSGLEAEYDSQLRGKNGIALSYQDVKGNSLETKTVSDPVGGNSINTSIDSDLQKYFYQAMEDQLSSLGRTAGAGLVMVPSTGEILSMVSLPSFDNNSLTGSLFTDKNRPTFNRSISGVYSPGSTIKPLVSFGALEEKIIDPLKKILSIGYIEIPNPFFPDKPSKFVDWRPQGWVDMRAALARSSNIYFYEVGGGFTDQSPNSMFGGGSQIGLGIERLKEYWKKFLLDQKTGIDLPGEAVGILPDVSIKEKLTGEPWRIGDTYNVAIGQGDLRITPIELLRYISTIPDRGKMPTPFVVQNITDSHNNVVYQAKPRFYSISSDTNTADYFNIIEQGMLDGVRKDYGTSYLLNDVPMTIAAKTGSAQIQNNQKTNAFFVGYNIPQINADGTRINADKNISDNQSLDQSKSAIPQQIAVLVLIEDAKEGSLNAVPVAKKVFQWYYDNRIVKK
jgi:penicillin-binding protein 2